MRTDLGSPSYNVVMWPSLTIAGVTRNYLSQALPACLCHLFLASSDIKLDTQTSDTAGAYSFNVQDRAAYYVVAIANTTYHADLTTILADSTVVTVDDTQVDGTTLNSLVGV